MHSTDFKRVPIIRFPVVEGETSAKYSLSINVKNGFCTICTIFVPVVTTKHQLYGENLFSLSVTRIIYIDITVQISSYIYFFRTNYFYISKDSYWRKIRRCFDRLHSPDIRLATLEIHEHHNGTHANGVSYVTVYQFPDMSENARVNFILTKRTTKENENLCEPNNYSGLNVLSRWL